MLALPSFPHVSRPPPAVPPPAGARQGAALAALREFAAFVQRSRLQCPYDLFHFFAGRPARAGLSGAFAADRGGPHSRLFLAVAAGQADQSGSHSSDVALHPALLDLLLPVLHSLDPDAHFLWRQPASHRTHLHGGHHQFHFQLRFGASAARGARAFRDRRARLPDAAALVRRPGRPAHRDQPHDVRAVFRLHHDRLGARPVEAGGRPAALGRSCQGEPAACLYRQPDRPAQPARIFRTS